MKFQLILILLFVSTFVAVIECQYNYYPNDFGISAYRPRGGRRGGRRGNGRRYGQRRGYRYNNYYG